MQWAYDTELDVLQLKTLQFDYMRMNDFPDAKKSYREISHQGNGKNFFSHEDIWAGLVSAHLAQVDSVTAEMGTVEDFIASHPDFASRVDAARARDSEWNARVRHSMRSSFAKASNTLEVRVSEDEPKEFLRRAWLAILKIDPEARALVGDAEALSMLKEINSACWELKKSLE